MTAVGSTSAKAIARRRQRLQRRRRRKTLQALWRSLLLGGLTGALAWSATLPQWHLRQPSQIHIRGNQRLSDAAIRRLAAAHTGSSFLLGMEVRTLSERLEAQLPIAEATVSRQLLPPRLIVTVAERDPVAVAVPAQQPQAAVPIDARGRAFPASSDRGGGEHPELKVLGFRDRYRSQWPQLYRTLARSRVEVSALDWRQPGNLILKTALGEVHLGPYRPQRFRAQLAALARLQALPERIDYIDLQVPEAPTVRVRASANAPPPSSGPN